MYKHQIKSLTLVALYALTPFASFAASVHKWVDENGVTHYSDQAPGGQVAHIDQLEISNVYRQSNVEEDYYSISNQWARMHTERLERKKIQLEKAKLKQSQSVSTPEVVYFAQEQESHRQVYYPVFANTIGHFGKKHYRNGFRKGFNHNSAGASCKIPRNNNSRSGLKLTIR